MPLRSINAARYVTPLREGGSLPAVIEGDDDGLYVLKFRGAGQGAEGAGRRAGRGRDRARARPADSGTGLRRARPGTGAHRAGSGDPGADPRQRRAQPRARLPARLDHLRPGRRARRCRAGLGRRLVRRLRQQRRPQRPQSQPAGLAPQALADRPRRGALLPPRLGRLARACRQCLPDDPRTRAAAAGATTSPAPTRGWRPKLHAEASRRSWRSVPDAWLAGADTPRRSGRASRRLRRTFHAAAGAAPALRRGGDPCTRLTRRATTTTR